MAVTASLSAAEIADRPGDPCATAVAEGIVCQGANQRALEIMRAANLDAITIVQHVHTGQLVAFAASDPAKLDVTTSLLPLSTVKLLVAASWWDHEQPRLTDSPQLSVTEMLVTGNDQAGRRMASALRRAIGTQAVLNDFDRYGFPALPSSAVPKMDENFWVDIAPRWKITLAPAAAYNSLNRETTTKDWEDTLSIGESKFRITALHLSRFLQAVGNGGIMLHAVAREDGTASRKSDPERESIRVMHEDTALKLQTAMRDTVTRGTAKAVSGVLIGTDWQIGGKTGTGPGPEPPGPHSDGWFAGLIFDPRGSAQFTVATFVKRGGYGGGNAARISAELARFLSGADSPR